MRMLMTTVGIVCSLFFFACVGGDSEIARHVDAMVKASGDKISVSSADVELSKETGSLTAVHLFAPSGEQMSLAGPSSALESTAGSHLSLTGESPDTSNLEIKCECCDCNLTTNICNCTNCTIVL